MYRLAAVLLASCVLVAAQAPCEARPFAPDAALETGGSSNEPQSLPYIQCVPYARKVSGIQLYGDAHTWWGQAAGRYARGTRPKVGAVMAFRPHGAMQLGHVAAISRVIDARTVLLRHSNWSLIDGRRGQPEDDVRAVDVSPGNDWSEVRVWYAPLGGLGTTHWPLEGFIYNRKPLPNERTTVLASAAAARPSKAGYTSRIGADFLSGILPEPDRIPAGRQLASHEVPSVSQPPSLRNDPIGRIIASRLR